MVQWLKHKASNAEGTGSIPGRGTKIPHATWYGQKIKIIIIIKNNSEDLLYDTCCSKSSRALSYFPQHLISVSQSVSSVTQSCPTSCDPMDCGIPGFSVYRQLLELAQTHVYRVSDASNHLIFCHPLLLPSIFPNIRLFSSESVLCIRWPKYWSFSFSFRPCNQYSALISFRMDWLDLLAFQGTLKSLLQHYCSKVSVLWCSAFFMAQLSHSYMTTGKAIALIRWTFVSKVMSLLYNLLSRFVITFLPRSKCLFISWLQSPSAVILEPKKIKSDTVSIVSPSICHAVMEPNVMIFIF